MEEPLVKFKPDDFIVVENLVLPLAVSEPNDLALSESSRDAPDYSYLRLRKSGYTTFEAAARLSTFFCVPPASVAYAGLKDEDGITEQTFSIPLEVKQSAIELFNLESRTASTRYITLSLLGTGREPLSIGRLNGNGFRVVLRKLLPAQAVRLPAKQKAAVWILNYYDTQRFGVPDGPKTTHLIGAALLQNDYAEALRLVRHAGTPESKLAQDISPNSACAFFDTLDQRVTNFYKSSFASSEWNAKLASCVASAFPDSVVPVEYQNIPYAVLTSTVDVARFVAHTSALPMKRYYGNQSSSMRQTVVQAQVYFGEPSTDEAHPGFLKQELTFFLPSGCYATMLLKQVLRFQDLVDRETILH